jgi:PRTRC genetic system protein E
MFQELLPLLSQRVLILTLSRVTEQEVCVNVIPKPLKSDQRDDDAALTTPLAVTGTPKELDEQLPRQLVEFVETHLGLSSTLKSAKEQMEAAAKAARETARKSTTSKSHGGPGRSPSSTQLQTQTDAQVRSGDLQSGAEPTHAVSAEAGAVGPGATTGSLFDLESKNDN